MDLTRKPEAEEKPDPVGGYTAPIARKGEQQFACIMRNRSGISSGDIDFGARFIDHLSDADQQSAVNMAYCVYEKWCRETGKRAPRDKSEALEKDFAYHSELCTIQQARLEKLREALKLINDRAGYGAGVSDAWLVAVTGEALQPDQEDGQ